MFNDFANEFEFQDEMFSEEEIERFYQEQEDAVIDSHIWEIENEMD